MYFANIITILILGQYRLYFAFYVLRFVVNITCLSYWVINNKLNCWNKDLVGLINLLNCHKAFWNVKAKWFIVMRQVWFYLKEAFVFREKIHFNGTEELDIVNIYAFSRGIQSNHFIQRSLPSSYNYVSASKTIRVAFL